ncbi:MAG: stage II sporulation protein R [Lachnospiraceae bacterium]
MKEKIAVVKKKKVCGETWIKVLLIIFLVGIVLICVGEYDKKTKMTNEIAEKIIRFHVLANSDTEEDQQLKLEVRDAIGMLMQPKLSGISDITRSREIVTDNLKEIEEKAETVIASKGYTYPVSARLAQTKFPEKTYGTYTFPKGTYEALEVVIGEGEGHNWWCVMYPNMCFFNSTYDVVEEEAEKSLGKILTKEEYKSLVEEKDYEVKFAFLDFLEDMKESVAFSL